MLSVPQAAKRAGLSESALRGAIRDKVLPAERIGNAYAITEEDLDEFIAELDDQAEDADVE